MTQQNIPNNNQSAVDGKGRLTTPFYRFLSSLQLSASGGVTPAQIKAIEAQIAALQAEIDALPEGSYPTLDVTFPITTQGLLQNGYAQLSWQGTTDNVPENDPPTNLYFTDARFYADLKAQLVEGSNITLTPDDSGETITVSASGETGGTTDQYRRGDQTWQELAAAVLATALTGFSTSDTDPVVAADEIIAALGKLQAQVTNRLPLDGSAKMAGPYQWQYQTAGDFYNGIISQDYDFAGNKLRERRIGSWGGGTVRYAYDDLYGTPGSVLVWQWMSNGTPVAHLTTTGTSAPTAEFQTNQLTVRDFIGGGNARWRYDSGLLHLDITSPSDQYTGDVVNVSSALNSRAWTFFGPTKFGEYTLATTPSAATYSGYYITVTDATGGAKLCRSDGTNWNLVNTSTPVS